VGVIVFRAADSVESAVLALALLLLSKSFVDYSTSGLETPLTHLLLGTFGIVYLRGGRRVAALGALGLLSALAALNRLDVSLMLLPALVWAALRSPSHGRLRSLLPGIILLLLWEAFSIVYYGFPFPNTAYAKLQTGISRLELLEQGAVYFASLVGADPVTAVAILAGVAVPFSLRRYDLLPLTAGICLYLLYVLVIGGDYMLGRFFTGPLVLAAVMLGVVPLREHRRVWTVTLLAIVGLGLAPSGSPLYSDATYGSRNGGRPVHKFHGVSDERAFYYPTTGLLRALQPGGWPDWPAHHWALAGKAARSRGPHVIFMRSVGLYGYHAGPAVHVIDPLALGDALLARLPAEYDPNWLPGHFTRAIPAGYYETLATGVNVIEDKDLAAYYDKLSLVTRGPLLDPARLSAIWSLNTGRYAHLVDAELYRFPPPIRVDLREVAAPKAEGTLWNQAGNFRFRAAGVEVELEKPTRARRLEVSLDGNDDYELLFIDGTVRVARLPVPARPAPEGGLAVHVIEVPEPAVNEGYDAVLIRPLRGDNAYVLGHLRLLE
jgi:arabinofuranosyltransferase